jgi:hypothetical protein
MMRLLFLISILMTVLGASSQDTSFVSLIGGVNDDKLCDIHRIGDSYYLIGTTATIGYGQSDIYMAKTDTMGNTLQTWFLGSEQIDVATSAVLIGDSLIAICGYTNANYANGYDMLLTITDTSGNQRVRSTFGGSDWDFGNDISFDAAGYLVIAGETYSYGNGAVDGYLVKCNLQGNMVWERKFGDVRDDRLKVIQPFLGNRYLVGAEMQPVTDSSDLALMWLDTSGVLIDSVMWGGTGVELINDIYQHTDASFVVAGGTSSIGAAKPNFLLLRIDTTGYVHWQEVIGGPEHEEWQSVVRSTGSGSVLATGFALTTLGSGGEEYFMLRYSLGGFFENLTTFGGAGNDRAIKVISPTLALYGSLIIAGYTNSTGSGANDMVLYMTRQNGTVSDSSALHYVQNSQFYTGLPQHTEPSAVVRSLPDGFQISTGIAGYASLEVIDAKGRLVYSRYGMGDHFVPSGYLQAGVYVYRISAANGTLFTGKLLGH